MLNPQELGRLFDAHARALLLYARQLCEEPEDAVQEAYLKLAERDAVPPEPAAWLFRIARNAALMGSRSRRRRRRRESAVATRSEWFTPMTCDAVDAGWAVAALESLTREDRELVTARLWGGLSFQELGGLLGISDSAAHRRYAAALETLRKRMGVSCPKTN